MARVEAALLPAMTSIWVPITHKLHFVVASSRRRKRRRLQERRLARSMGLLGEPRLNKLDEQAVLLCGGLMAGHSE